MLSKASVILYGFSHISMLLICLFLRLLLVSFKIALVWNDCFKSSVKFPKMHPKLHYALSKRNFYSLYSLMKRNCSVQSKKEMGVSTNRKPKKKSSHISNVSIFKLISSQFSHKTKNSKRKYLESISPKIANLCLVLHWNVVNDSHNISEYEISSTVWLWVLT